MKIFLLISAEIQEKGKLRKEDPEEEN